MFHNRPALRAMNEAAWAALAWGAQDLADNPLPEEVPEVPLPPECMWPTCACPDDGLCPDCPQAPEPVCENCGGTEEVTRDGPLGHIERKPCPECQGEWW